MLASLAMPATHAHPSGSIVDGKRCLRVERNRIVFDQEHAAEVLLECTGDGSATPPSATERFGLPALHLGASSGPNLDRGAKLIWQPVAR